MSEDTEKNVTTDEPEGDEHTNTRVTEDGVEGGAPDKKPTPSGLPRVDTIPELPNRPA